MRSIEKYPLRLETGSDCRILYGFGEKICQAIDQKLNVQKKPTSPVKKTIQRTTSMSQIDDRIKPSIMINLSDHDQDETSSSPIKRAKIEPTKKTIKKTTSAGAKLATNNRTISSTQQPTTISTLLGIVDLPTNNNLTLPKPVQTLKPGSFDITLCIDNAEASRSTQKILLEHLTKNSISYDIRKLNIGDFLWTVRRKSLISSSFFSLNNTFNHLSAKDKSIQVEAILDYIVERKRLDDLSKSIIDGRYNEQKVS